MGEQWLHGAGPNLQAQAARLARASAEERASHQAAVTCTQEATLTFRGSIATFCQDSDLPGLA